MYSSCVIAPIVYNYYKSLSCFNISERVVALDALILPAAVDCSSLKIAKFEKQSYWLCQFSIAIHFLIKYLTNISFTELR